MMKTEKIAGGKHSRAYVLNGGRCPCDAVLQISFFLMQPYDHTCHTWQELHLLLFKNYKKLT